MAHDRRHHEMVQVTQTMRELGVEPLMTAATQTFFERSRALGLSEAFPELPRAMDEVIAYVETHLEE